MPHFQVIRKINKIENRLCKIEKSVEDQLEGITVYIIKIDIDEKIKNYKEVDPFDQLVELIMLFCTSFKLIILGAAIIIPWNSIRDFWVKISMCVFLVKSSKRIRKTWKKGKKRNNKDTESTTSTSNETLDENLIEKEKKEDAINK